LMACHFGVAVKKSDISFSHTMNRIGPFNLRRRAQGPQSDLLNARELGGAARDTWVKGHIAVGDHHMMLGRVPSYGTTQITTIRIDAETVESGKGTVTIFSPVGGLPHTFVTRALQDFGTANLVGTGRKLDVSVSWAG